MGGLPFGLAYVGLIERGAAFRDVLFPDKDNFDEESHGAGHEADEFSGGGVEHGTCIHEVTIVAKDLESNKKVH